MTPLRPHRRLVLPSLLVAATVLGLPALLLQSKALAGDLKARVVGHDALHPAVLASVASPDRHAWTIRARDPLVPPKFSTIVAKPDKDTTIAIYGAGDGTAFGQGAVIHLAGGRAVPSTVVIPTGVAYFLRNDDPFVHHIVGPDVDRDLKPGEAHKMMPKGKGVTSISDTLVSSCKAWIVVDDGVLANRMPGPDGTLKIAELAVGDYVIKAFFEGKERYASPPFKVPATGSIELKDPIVVGVAPSASASK